MATFVNLVMEAAAIELLREEVAEIEQEVQRLLSEGQQATDEESYHGVFRERFMELLKRRGEIAREAVILFEQSMDPPDSTNRQSQSKKAQAAVYNERSTQDQETRPLCSEVHRRTIFVEHGDDKEIEVL